MRARWMWRGVWVAAMAVALAGAAWAGEAFEGKLSFQISSKDMPGGQPMAMEYVVKKGIVRVETKMAGAGNYTLINPAEKKMSIVMPAQKMVMEMAFGAADPPAPVKAPEITKGDKTEKVTFKSDGTTLTLVKAGEDAGAGAKTFEGQQWLVKMETMSSEQWVAKDLTALAGFVETFKAMAQGPNAAWMKKLELPGFPYKMVTKDADGNVTSEMTLVGVDTKSPDDALFTIPEDYKKMAMPVMPQVPKE